MFSKRRIMFSSSYVINIYSDMLNTMIADGIIDSLLFVVVGAERMGVYGEDMNGPSTDYHG